MIDLVKTYLENDRVQLFQIPSLGDNYIYLIAEDQKGIAIDAGDSEEILPILIRENITLQVILSTHHHMDHTAGNCLLKEKTGCQVYGPDDQRIPCLGKKLKEGPQQVGPYQVEVISTPGHTCPHYVYYVPKWKILFSGDTLFSGGCGRLFEGSPEEMVTSLDKITKLPKETKIYCGHEYSIKNVEFALSLEPSNIAIQIRLQKLLNLRSNDKPGTPSLLSEELETNPFLRLNSPELLKALNLEGATPLEVFICLRKMKDIF